MCFIVISQREAKVQLFRDAVDAYSELITQVNKGQTPKSVLCPVKSLSTHVFALQALKGHGIDRHLLGLKLQAIEEGYSIPKVFMDTAYGVATHWKLRTGQVCVFGCVLLFACIK